jgi:isopentenyldiphosphate isomerase
MFYVAGSGTPPMNATSLDMEIDVVDDEDRSIGVIKRSEVFARRVNFRVAHVFIFNRNQELLVQQLAFTRERNPGQWGSSVAAYLFAGEAYSDAAVRRVSEELHTNDCVPQRFGKTVMIDNGCKKFITLFTGSSDGPFQYDRSHIAQIQFLPISEIVLMHRSNARIFTPTFLTVLEFYQSHK